MMHVCSCAVVSMCGDHTVLSKKHLYLGSALSSAGRCVVCTHSMHCIVWHLWHRLQCLILQLMAIDTCHQAVHVNAPNAYQTACTRSGWGIGSTLELHFRIVCAMAALQCLSYVCAAGNACDKIVLLARMVQSNPCLQKSSNLQP